MPKHERRPLRVRRAATGVGLTILTVLAAFGVISLLPFADQPAAAPVALAPPPAPAPAPATTNHEHHIAVAQATPAGQAAAAASDRVTRDRQAAAGDPAARAIQARLDQATDGPLMFGPDTAMLTADSEAKVARIVSVLRTEPTARVEVVGHTAVEIDDPPLCLQLSQLRAEQVVIRLAAAGIDPARMSAVGVSHTQPKDTASASRRAELIALSG